MEEYSKPYFSVIIPTYNRAGLILKTIESVLNQEEKSFEVIIVDDGSTDDTEKVVDSIKDKRVKYFYKENAERAVARNFGAHKSVGTFITFLDSDDLFYQNHLSTARNFIKNKVCKIFFQQYEFTRADGSKQANYTPKKEKLNESLIRKGNFFSCMGVFIEREVFLENLFNENRDLSGSEDYELWLRMAARHSIYFSNVITSTLIYHDERSVLNMGQEPLIKRIELMLHYLFSDEKFVNKYGGYKSILLAEGYSYISLHLVMSKYTSKGFFYLLKSLKAYPINLFKKRTFAIIRRILIRPSFNP